MAGAAIAGAGVVALVAGVGRQELAGGGWRLVDGLEVDGKAVVRRILAGESGAGRQSNGSGGDGREDEGLHGLFPIRPGGDTPRPAVVMVFEEGSGLARARLVAAVAMAGAVGGVIALVAAFGLQELALGDRGLGQGFLVDGKAVVRGVLAGESGAGRQSNGSGGDGREDESLHDLCPIRPGGDTPRPAVVMVF